MVENAEQAGNRNGETQAAETANVVENVPTPVDTVVKALYEEAKREAEFKPRGAFRFVLVLIAGYALYFFLIWYEIVVLRGGA
jgi:hypothetical protein